jgi:hypothetical protein
LQANKTDPKHLEHDWKERMRTSSLLIVATIMLSPTLALAQGASPGAQSIASEFYGNNSNPRDGGHGVLPSLAPGPWACGDHCSDFASAGMSVGELLGVVYGHGNADFANGTDKTKTNFSK